MNMSKFSEFQDTMNDDAASRGSMHTGNGEPPLVVQILSVIAFGAFSIVGIALAFATFWVAGLVLAIVLAGIWSGNRTFGGHRKWRSKQVDRTINNLAPAVSEQRATGNASFDAYRGDMLERLEQESRDFEGFLMRLREARDATEFDQFMDDRAAKSHDTITGA